MKLSRARLAWAVPAISLGLLAGCGGGGGGSNPTVGLDPSNVGPAATNLLNGSAQVFLPNTGIARVNGTVDPGSAVAGRGASAAVAATISVSRYDVAITTGVATETNLGSISTDGIGRFALNLEKNKLYKLVATFNTAAGSKSLRKWVLPGDTHDRTQVMEIDVDVASTAQALALEVLVGSSTTDTLTWSAINTTVRGYASFTSAVLFEAAVRNYLAGAAGAPAAIAATDPALAASAGLLPVYFCAALGGTTTLPGLGTQACTGGLVQQVVGAAIPGQAGVTLGGQLAGALALNPLPADANLYTQLTQALTVSLAAAQAGAATLDGQMAALAAAGGGVLALANWPAARLAPANFRTNELSETNYRNYGINAKPSWDLYDAHAVAYESQNNTFQYGRDAAERPAGTARRSLTYTTVRGFMIVPKGTAPAGGWPVIHYQHGVTRQAADIFLFSDDFVRAGYAVVAIDAVLHGRRQPGGRTSTGAALSTAEDAGVLADIDPANDPINDVPNNAAGGALDCRIQGADTDVASISNGSAYLLNYYGCGWAAGALAGLVPRPTMVNGNPVYTSQQSYLTPILVRDNQIQTVEDHRALQTWVANNGEARGLNPRRVYYVGMSLGVLIGGISVAVNTNVDTTTANPLGRYRAAVFNVGGVGWGNILNTTDDADFGGLAQTLLGASCPSPIVQDYKTCSTATTSALGALIAGTNSTGTKVWTGGEPGTWVGGIKVPVHLQQGADDKVFKPVTSNGLQTILNAAGVRTTRTDYSANHGFFLDIASPNSDAARNEIINFFNQNSNT